MAGGDTSTDRKKASDIHDGKLRVGIDLPPIK